MKTSKSPISVRSIIALALALVMAFGLASYLGAGRIDVSAKEFKFAPSDPPHGSLAYKYEGLKVFPVDKGYLEYLQNSHIFPDVMRDWEGTFEKSFGMPYSQFYGRSHDAANVRDFWMTVVTEKHPEYQGQYIVLMYAAVQYCAGKPNDTFLTPNDEKVFGDLLNFVYDLSQLPDDAPVTDEQEPFEIEGTVLKKYWGESNGVVVVPDGITEIRGPGFSDNETIKALILPEGLKWYDDNCVYGCTNLTEVYIPNGCKIYYNLGQKYDYYQNPIVPNLTDIYFGDSEIDWLKINDKSVLRDFDGNVHFGATPADITVKPSEPTKPVQPEQPEKPIIPEVKFTDVSADAWYAEAVNWAISKGITNGNGDGTFAPSRTCNNTEIITFLYRANGSPKVEASLPFTPVDSWAVDALKWAYSKNIIGADFDQKTPCTRMMAVDYLWKCFDKPTTDTTNAFVDLDSNVAHLTAVNWTVSKKIVGGTTATTFSPDLTCDRGTIVTLLYRAYK